MKQGNLKLFTIPFIQFRSKNPLELIINKYTDARKYELDH